MTKSTARMMATTYSLMLQYYENLVRKRQRTHAVLDDEQVEPDRVQVLLARRRLGDETSAVESREVHRAGADVTLAGVQAQRNDDDVVREVRTDRVRAVEVRRRLGEVRLRQAEVADVDAVHLKLQAVRGARERDGASRARGGTNSLDRVIEVEIVNLRVRRQGLLHRGDEVLQRRAGEEFALRSVQVDVVRVHFPLVADLGAPINPDFHVHVLKRDERKRLGERVREPKLERVELRVRRSTEHVAVRRLHVVRRHDRRRQTLREHGVLLVDDLTTDHQLNLIDHGAPIGDRRVRLGTVRERGQVDVREKIALTLETNGRHRVRLHLTLNGLTLHRLGEVRVGLVNTAEVAHGRISRDLFVLGTDREQLRDTRTHGL
ncbi:hypothetical protein DSLPV1_065 [Dishui lake phycodnavirus 1]|uniref:hypothetical protein n=1 Tax=Dishui lake phycodnavirus 1 TaxID=2079134 RepID=UPI000CD67978|nr:hypothetical protein C5Y57_gp065 [Dishui lake phycodnavirus 1]AUT19036.1 hypothetical protein DSLPV1_065 [Dishui lake phycodnavirus 1]